jgi:hypothetical protein
MLFVDGHKQLIEQIDPAMNVADCKYPKTRGCPWIDAARRERTKETPDCPSPRYTSATPLADPMDNSKSELRGSLMRATRSPGQPIGGQRDRKPARHCQSGYNCEIAGVGCLHPVHD